MAKFPIVSPLCFALVCFVSTCFGVSSTTSSSSSFRCDARGASLAESSFVVNGELTSHELSSSGLSVKTKS